MISEYRETSGQLASKGQSERDEPLSRMLLDRSGSLESSQDQKRDEHRRVKVDGFKVIYHNGWSCSV